MDVQIAEAEIDVFDYSQRGEEVPHGKKFRIRIDCETVIVDTPDPKGGLLLARVGKRPCAYELIAEFVHCENRVIEPDETVDLRQRGLKGFITAHKEFVTIFIGGPEHPYRIERGERTVAEILGKVDKTTDGYVLLEEKDGHPPLPLPANLPVKIHGCEMFYTQPQTGGSS
jgi:Multiubiquitin